MRYRRLLLILTAIITMPLTAPGAADPLVPGSNAPAATQPEIRRGQEMSGSSEERSKRFYEQLVRRVEPTGVGTVDRLPAYASFFLKEFVEDPRQFAVDIRFEPQPDGAVALVGWAEFPEHAKAAAAYLQQLGFANVIDRVEPLPSKDLGDTPFAIVNVDRAFIYDKPGTQARRETLTECVAGDRLFLLKQIEGNQYLCHGPDGYVGYIDGLSIERVRADNFDAPPDWRATDDRVERALASAMKLSGTPYVWGGTTADGIDCSGLVFRSFKQHGVNLPRDADQQSLVGRLVATRWHRAGLRRGDTLYFLSRRGTIHHTAIYLGDGKYLEAANPGVKVSSFNKQDPEYDARRDETFCFAKRLFD